MGSNRTLKRTHNIAQLGLQPTNATTGVWTIQLSSGIFTLHKAAASTTSVVNIPIPHGPRGGQPTNEDASPSVIEVFYLVSTANLTGAPTVALNKHTMLGGTGTGVTSSATVANSLTFAGVDGVGTAFGTATTGAHIAVVTITTPVTLADTDSLVLTITMNEASTSVLDISGIAVTYL